MKIDDVLHGLTTYLTGVTASGEYSGSGFFYQQLSPADPAKGPQWRAIERMWLVTNRHVAFPNEEVPQALTFNLRRRDGTTPKWDPITLSSAEVSKRARVSPDASIDVCVIDVLDLLVERQKSGTSYQPWSAVHEDRLPGRSKLGIEVADDAIVVGYPRGFYDQVNLFPIVKAGIVASRWGAFFDGKPYFLLDAKLFPGSSGSIVLSKPTRLAMIDGNLATAAEKNYLFLGIYSGEPYLQGERIELEEMSIIRKSGFNLGIVWYGFLVDAIIKADVAFAPSSAK